MLNLLLATLTENESYGPSKSTPVMEYHPRCSRGTQGTGLQKDSGVLLLLNLNKTLIHFFTLIITAWLHSHHSWTCPHNCSRRSYDHLMRQSSPSRISPVCRQALASSLLIERGKHLGLINLYALQMRPSNVHPNPKNSQNLLRLPAGPAVRASRGSRFLKRM